MPDSLIALVNEFLRQLPSLVMWLVALVVALAGVWVLFNALKGRGPRVKARPILTDNEREFFARLRRALPDYEILPQVAMSALILPTISDRSSADYRRIRNLYAQKVVDFVVCRPRSLAVVALVELDDITHHPARDAARDALLGEAGLTVVRWHSRRKPSLEEIAERFVELSQKGGSPAPAAALSAAAPSLPRAP